jgi:hypothetical protein
LHVKAPFEGTWVSREIEHGEGAYLRRGESVGFVGSLEDLIVRATAGQDVAAMLFEEAAEVVEMRVKGCPEVTLVGHIEKIFPAGQDVLPSEALGYAAGGAMPTRAHRARDATAAERFFEIRISPQNAGEGALLTGQRVVARIRMRDKPLAAQWWRLARRLFQRRFHI